LQCYLATDLLTRELLKILDTVPRMPSNIDELVAAIVNYTDAAKENEFLNAIIETRPRAAYHILLSVASVKAK